MDRRREYEQNQMNRKDAGPQQKRLRRTRHVLLLAALSIYLITYSIFSSHGSYVGYNQGGNDNRDSWYPASCAEPYSSNSGRQKVRLTWTGVFFLPPLIFDQLIVHRDRFNAE